MSELNSIDSSSVSCASAAIRSEITFNSNRRRAWLIRSLGCSAPAASLTSSWGLSGTREGPRESENTLVHYSEWEANLELECLGYLHQSPMSG